MMTKLLLQYIWTQRAKNAWVLLELFIGFVALWYIVDTFTCLGLSSTSSMGVEIRDVYRIHYGVQHPDHPDFINYENDREQPGRNFLRMVERIKAHPQVEFVSIGRSHYPYCAVTRASDYHKDSALFRLRMLEVSPEYFPMFQVKPLGGGSPEMLAEAIREKGIILSETAANTLFPKQKAVGQYLYKGDSSRVYITALSSAFKDHEYTRPSPYAFSLFDEAFVLHRSDNSIRNSVDILVKAKAGLKDFAYSFQQEMRPQLAIGNFLLADVVPLKDVRKVYLDSLGLISKVRTRLGFGLFFIINIFLGVLGTFWLRAKKREPEIGLRMAMGATKRQIVWFLLYEGFLMLCIASVPGMLVCLNLIATQSMPTDYMDPSWVRFAWDSLITYLLLTLVIAASILYPAQRAARTQPAAALYCE